MSKEYERVTEYKNRDFPDLFRELPTLGRQLDCPNCGTSIKFDNINMEKTMAKCHNCTHVFPFENQVKDKRKARKRAEVFQPEGVEMFRLQNELNIDYKWRNTVTFNYVILFFTLVWNAILIPLVTSAVISGEFVALLFMSLHIALGVWFLLAQMSRFINSTYITVNEHYIQIEHRPLSKPWFPNKMIPVKDIEQLYVSKTRTNEINGIAQYGYAIILVDKKDKREIALVTGIKNSDKALFIEQEIEYFLNIEDRRVKEEIL